MGKHLHCLFELRDMIDLMCCIPADSVFAGSERMEFEETPAMCIYYRGTYEGTATAIHAPMEHIRENGIETTGPFCAIYLEGSPQLLYSQVDTLPHKACIFPPAVPNPIINPAGRADPPRQ